MADRTLSVLGSRYRMCHMAEISAELRKETLRRALSMAGNLCLLLYYIGPGTGCHRRGVGVEDNNS